MDDTAAEVLREMDLAERRAWESLARYKFMMFGYWAAMWVHLNRVGRFKRPNPWKALVMSARERAPAQPVATLREAA